MFLELGEGQEDLAFHPAEPHQPEQADKPRPGRQREAEDPGRRRRSGWACLRVRGHDTLCGDGATAASGRTATVVSR